MSTKITALRIQTTVTGRTKVIAAMISLLDGFYNSNDLERVLRTVAFHFGFKLERL